LHGYFKALTDLRLVLVPARFDYQPAANINIPHRVCITRENPAIEQLVTPAFTQQWTCRIQYHEIGALAYFDGPAIVPAGLGTTDSRLLEQITASAAIGPTG
jgi:hypothetical protein